MRGKLAEILHLQTWAVCCRAGTPCATPVVVSRRRSRFLEIQRCWDSGPLSGHLGTSTKHYNQHRTTCSTAQGSITDLPSSPNRNLGRAGYGATLDGTWPYVYDSCDIGTLPNQTNPVTGGPDVSPELLLLLLSLRAEADPLPPQCVTTEGDQYNNYDMSYLLGQKLSACTCPGEE